MKKKFLIALPLFLIYSLFIGCDTTSAEMNKDLLTFSSINDISYKEPIKTNKNLKKTEKKIESSVNVEQTNEEEQQLLPSIEKAEEETFELESAPVVEEYTEEIEEIEEPSENIEEYSEELPKEEINSDGLTKESGVNSYDGRTETYYSSEALYHQDTDEWTVDDEGFYRTDEGYYVVAASDMPQGTTFEGSKGTCVVLDSGCDEGITDYYVSWS